MANEISNPNSYVTVSGLETFLTQIKAKYAANTSESYKVNCASESGKLSTARTISFATGDVTGSFSFDGSANVSDVALSIGSGKVTNAMLAGSIAQTKILGTGEGKTLADDLGTKVDKVTGYGLSKNDFTDELKTKLDNIEAGGQVNVIETVKVNGTALKVSSKAVNVTVATGTDNGTLAVNGTDVAVKGLASAAYTASTAYTSAEKGTELEGRIENLEARGRFLSTWDCSTGLPETDPPSSSLVDGKYNYKSGDYYVVGKVSSATPAVNYKPNGSYYKPQEASTTVETNTKVAVGDFYLYDGTSWKLLENTQKTITISQVEGLQTALDGKVATTTKVNNKALSADITLDGSDVALTGYAKGSSSAAIAATDTINEAFGKVENQIDAEASARATAITTAIQALDAEVTSTDGTKVAVKVTEVDGKITAVNVTETDIASAALLGTTSDTKTDATAFGYIANEADARATADTSLSTAIGAEETRAKGIESGLDTRLGTAETKLNGIEAGAQVNKIEAIKLSDSTSALTITDKTVVIPNATTSADGLMSSEDKTKIDGMQAGATKVEASLTNGNIKINGTETTVYTHPSYTAKAADLYVMTVDATGHVSAATAATYSDLPIAKSDLDGTIGVASASANGLMSSTHYSKLEGLVAATTADINSIFA